MTILQRQRLTLEEFLALPERKPALEYECGTVTRKVSPKGPHGRLQFWLARLVDRSDSSVGRAAAFTETRVTLGGRSRVPDIMVYRWERIPRDPDGRVAENFVTPPDVVVEILSPGQSAAAQGRRCAWFVAHGVPVALSVDPRRETIERFAADRVPVILTRDDVVDLDATIPGLRFAAREAFEVLWMRR